MNYCEIDKAMSSKQNEYKVTMKENVIKHFAPIQGSLSVLQARIMGLSYPDFLRYVRDTYNARLAGVGHKYPAIYFPDAAAASKFALILDKRFKEILLQLNKTL